MASESCLWHFTGGRDSNQAMSAAVHHAAKPVASLPRAANAAGMSAAPRDESSSATQPVSCRCAGTKAALERA